MKNHLPLIIITACLLLNGCSLSQSHQQINTSEKHINSESELKNGVEPTEQPETNKKIDLSNQNLQKVPDYIFTQTSLKELNISNNKLTGSIQAEIRHLQNLTILNLSNNQMTGIPAEIGQLHGLQVLDLSNNQLTNLPYELGNLQNLKTLNISGNNYSEHDLNIIQKNLPKNIHIIK